MLVYVYKAHQQGQAMRARQWCTILNVLNRNLTLFLVDESWKTIYNKYNNGFVTNNVNINYITGVLFIRVVQYLPL